MILTKEDLLEQSKNMGIDTFINSYKRLDVNIFFKYLFDTTKINGMFSGQRWDYTIKPNKDE